MGPLWDGLDQPQFVPFPHALRNSAELVSDRTEAVNTTHGRRNSLIINMITKRTYGPDGRVVIHKADTRVLKLPSEGGFGRP
jgi:hypothetical protein